MGGTTALVGSTTDLQRFRVRRIQLCHLINHLKQLELRHCCNNNDGGDALLAINDSHAMEVVIPTGIIVGNAPGLCKDRQPSWSVKVGEANKIMVIDAKMVVIHTVTDEVTCLRIPGMPVQQHNLAELDDCIGFVSLFLQLCNAIQQPAGCIVVMIRSQVCGGYKLEFAF